MNLLCFATMAYGFEPYEKDDIYTKRVHSTCEDVITRLHKNNISGALTMLFNRWPWILDDEEHQQYYSDVLNEIFKKISPDFILPEQFFTEVGKYLDLLKDTLTKLLVAAGRMANTQAIQEKEKIQAQVIAEEKMSFMAKLNTRLHKIRTHNKIVDTICKYPTFVKVSMASLVGTSIGKYSPIFPSFTGGILTVATFYLLDKPLSRILE